MACGSSLDDERASFKAPHAQDTPPPSSSSSSSLPAKDEAGRTPLHWAAEAGQEDTTQTLLERGADAAAVDHAGDTPLHCAARAGQPMAAYQVCSQAPGASLTANKAGKTPIDIAVAGGKGEVLNAMLLACAGHVSADALAAMRALLAQGDASAVPDTWAPNGSSALMLAASVDSAEGCMLLLANGASMELQDALGRTALMFAAGNGAAGALRTLLDGGASISVRDRRGKNVMAYATSGSEVDNILQTQLAEMENKAAKLQAELLAELLGEEQLHKEGSTISGKGKSAKAAKKKGKAKAKKLAPAAAKQQQLAGQAGAKEELQPEERTQATTEMVAKPVEKAADVEPSAAALAGQVAAHHPRLQAGTAEGLEPSSTGTCSAQMSLGTAKTGGEQASGTAEADSPPSPEWQVVGHRSSKQHGRSNSSSRPGPASSMADAAIVAAAVGRMPRNLSCSSLCSDSSWDSHDTNLSRHSGSEKSVLRHTIRSSSAASTGSGRVLAVPVPAAQEPARLQPVKAPASMQASDSVAMNTRPAVPSVLSEVAFPPLTAVAPSVADAMTAAWQVPASSQPSSQPVTPPVASSPRPLRLQTEASSRDASVSPPLLSDPAARAEVAEVEPPAPTRAHSTLPPSLAGELIALRVEVSHLRQQLASAEVQHRLELAAVLEAAAGMVERERQARVYHVAAFLQNNAVELLHVLPELVGSASAPAGPASLNQLEFYGASRTGSAAAAAAVMGGGLSARLQDGASSLHSAGAVPGALAEDPWAPSVLPSVGSFLDDASFAVCSEPLAALSDLAACIGTPLSSSPVECTLQELEHLREEYGGAQRFLVPAASEPL